MQAQLPTGAACDDGVDCTPAKYDQCDPKGVCVGKPGVLEATAFCEADANKPPHVPVCTKQVCDPSSDADSAMANGCDTVRAALSASPPTCLCVHLSRSIHAIAMAIVTCKVTLRSAGDARCML